MDDDSTRRMGTALTAVAELVLLAFGPEQWVTGQRAIRYRQQFELLCEILEEANDKIDKHGGA